MNKYRITFVNPAFSPRASYQVVEAVSPDEAVQRFRECVNQANVVKTVGDRGVIRVEQLKDGDSC